MNREAFFNAIRPTFGNSLNQRRVDGMAALLDAGRNLPLHHMANVLAQVRRETGGIMYPIKETVLASHKNQDPTDVVVKQRLETAWKGGKLQWVKTPYWRDWPAWFGRGQIQISHKDNYDLFGIANPDDALKLDVSAMIAVKGMRDGMFRTRADKTRIKLADFDFPAALDLPPSQNPRRIVNGKDGSDAEVAKFHRQFAAALEKAGWGKDSPAPPPPVPAQQPPRKLPHNPLPPAAQAPQKGLLANLFTALVGIVRGH